MVTGVTRLEPHQLLAVSQKIERDLGRRTKGRNVPRTIDIDILFFGTKRIHTDDLVVPHVRWKQRDFVTRPLREVDWLAVARG